MATYSVSNGIVFGTAQVIVDKWQPSPECDLLSPEERPGRHRMSQAFYYLSRPVSCERAARIWRRRVPWLATVSENWGGCSPSTTRRRVAATDARRLTQAAIKCGRQRCAGVTKPSPSERAMHGGKGCHREPELARVRSVPLAERSPSQRTLFSLPAGCTSGGCLS
jgi:hypothetical protein